MGRLDAADEALREAEQVLAAQKHARVNATNLKYRADLCLSRQLWPRALQTFERVQALAQADPQPDLQVNACRGQTQALAALGRLLEVLSVWAHLHAAHALSAPLEFDPVARSSGSVSLHYLLLALDLAQGIAGYQVSGELLGAPAEAQARLGDTASAYATAKHAAEGRLRIQSEAAGHRMMAVQVMHQTERARAEAGYQGRLAAAQAQHAETLEQSMATLEQLGAAGRDRHLRAGRDAAGAGARARHPT